MEEKENQLADAEARIRALEDAAANEASRSQAEADRRAEEEAAAALAKDAAAKELVDARAAH